MNDSLVRMAGIASVLFIVASIGEAYLAEVVLVPHWEFVQQDYPTLLIGAALLCVWASRTAYGPVLRAAIHLAQLPRVTLGVYWVHPALLLVLVTQVPPLAASVPGVLLTGIAALVLSGVVTAALSRIGWLHTLVS